MPTKNLSVLYYFLLVFSSGSICCSSTNTNEEDETPIPTAAFELPAREYVIFVLEEEKHKFYLNLSLLVLNRINKKNILFQRSTGPNNHPHFSRNTFLRITVEQIIQNKVCCKENKLHFSGAAKEPSLALKKLQYVEQKSGEKVYCLHFLFKNQHVEEKLIVLAIPKLGIMDQGCAIWKEEVISSVKKGIEDPIEESEITYAYIASKVFWKLGLIKGEKCEFSFREREAKSKVKTDNQLGESPALITLRFKKSNKYTPKVFTTIKGKILLYIDGHEKYKYPIECNLKKPNWDPIGTSKSMNGDVSFTAVVCPISPDRLVENNDEPEAKVVDTKELPSSLTNREESTLPVSNESRHKPGELTMNSIKFSKQPAYNPAAVSIDTPRQSELTTQYSQLPSRGENQGYPKMLSPSAPSVVSSVVSYDQVMKKFKPPKLQATPSVVSSQKSQSSLGNTTSQSSFFTSPSVIIQPEVKKTYRRTQKPKEIVEDSAKTVVTHISQDSETKKTLLKLPEELVKSPVSQSSEFEKDSLGSPKELIKSPLSQSSDSDKKLVKLPKKKITVATHQSSNTHKKNLEDSVKEEKSTSQNENDQDRSLKPKRKRGVIPTKQHKKVKKEAQHEENRLETPLVVATPTSDNAVISNSIEANTMAQLAPVLNQSLREEKIDEISPITALSSLQVADRAHKPLVLDSPLLKKYSTQPYILSMIGLATIMLFSITSFLFYSQRQFFKLKHMQPPSLVQFQSGNFFRSSTAYNTPRPPRPTSYTPISGRFK